MESDKKAGTDAKKATESETPKSPDKKAKAKKVDDEELKVENLIPNLAPAALDYAENN